MTEKRYWEEARCFSKNNMIAKMVAFLLSVSIKRIQDTTFTLLH